MDEFERPGGVAERIPCAVCYFDLERRVRFCTREATRLLEQDADEPAGRRLEALEARPEFAEAFESSLSGRVPVARFTLRDPARPGSWSRWCLSAARDGQGMARGVWMAVEKGTGRDKNVGLRRAFKETRRLANALTRIDLLIHSVLDFDEIMNRVVVEAAKAMGAGSAAVYIPVDDLWEARYTYGRVAPIHGHRYTADEIKPSMKALKAGRPVLINDVSQEPIRDELRIEFGVKALLDAPLILAERPIGNLSLYMHVPGARFTRAHERFLSRVGASVSLAIQNAERIAQFHSAEAALRRSEERFRRQAEELEAIYQSAPVGLAVLDRDLRFSRVNERLAEFNGVPVEAHLGKRLRDVLPAAIEIFETMARRVFESGTAVMNYELAAETPARPGVQRFWNEHWLPLKDERGWVWGVNVVVEETTERKLLEEHTRHLAEHDPLTTLPNRLLFLELLEQALRAAARHRRKAAVLFLDLDRFKGINDKLGHDAGDALLKEVALRLQGKLRRSDTVARFGGDEFVVMLPEVARVDEVVEVAEQLIRGFERPFAIGEHSACITTSIGISVYPDDSHDSQGLLRHADMAMYEAKEHGRNTYRFHDRATETRARGRAQLEKALREALKDGGLQMDYQPEIELASGHVESVEALVRWNHADLGRLMPERFVPVAEESELIVKLDSWVLRAVCRQARQWLDEGVPPLRVSVNVSAKTFERQELVREIGDLMREFALPPGAIELEMTEHTLMRRVEAAIDRMRELAGLGVAIAVDDFGTGYSSLSYLKRLPLGKVKIDKSFVADIESNGDDQAIVRGITTLVHTLGKQVIAEGVERPSQRELLYAAGCDFAQGFLFRAPQSADAIGDLVRTRLWEHGVQPRG